MPLTAGTATLQATHMRSIAVTATDASGGTPPFTYAWQISRDGGSTWVAAVGIGVTTRTATLMSLPMHRLVKARLQFTDSASASVTSNVLTTTTHRGPRWVPCLRRD